MACASEASKGIVDHGNESSRRYLGFGTVAWGSIIGSLCRFSLFFVGRGMIKRWKSNNSQLEVLLCLKDIIWF
jgi:hypothetical protein